MLSHRGTERTFMHNLRLAVLLSFVGGLVNVIGFLSLKMMTTNLTGYLAIFVSNLLTLHWDEVITIIAIIFSFFFGAFTSHFILNIQLRLLKKVHFAVPLVFESIMLAVLGYYGIEWINEGYGLEVGCFMLFLMGLQNSLVTFISNAVIRTTHVTGIFTDLGIEVARLFFNFTNGEERKRLFALIGLKLSIVTSFCIGGLIGAYFFHLIGFEVLYIGSAVILFTSVYDYLKIKMKKVIEEGKKHVVWKKRKFIPSKDQALPKH